jgi:hypothetical protein
MALVLGSIIHAKLELLKTNVEFKPKLIHAVNTKKIWDPQLSTKFLSVAACGWRTEPLGNQNIIVTNNIQGRESNLNIIQRANPQYVTNLRQWMASRDGKRWIEFDISAFLGMDLGATSWASMMAYEKHDFGFGCPEALPRIPGLVEFLSATLYSFLDDHSVDSVESQ